MVIHSFIRRRGRSFAGFTLIELMVVLAIVALLLSVAVPRYFSGLQRSQEGVLRANLAATRDALDKYYGDTGRYPDSLEQLVQARLARSRPLALEQVDARRLPVKLRDGLARLCAPYL